ncbi:uncharacterized protein LOC128960971 [Oppia nitens]|uniref:uncharacterized protein LOC128960971 n=1 Tax=Oppia nitens TaxID=1686743 RepID=UPI0023D9C1A8|nr:uncharacterized protein LOC128960971 [Oppia nitens]
MSRHEAVIMAAEANKKAESGHYYAAIELYSRAIDLYPFDYRFYLNRAYCYEKIDLFHLAFTDSEEAIKQQPNIEKCYFRKARALTGLREYQRAEETYKMVLKTNPNCPETRRDLIQVRCEALQDMGFDREMAIKSAMTSDSIREAIDQLLATAATNEDVYNNANQLPVDNYVDANTANNNGYTSDLTADDDNSDDNNDTFPNLTSIGGEDLTTQYEPGFRYADKARKWAQVVESIPTQSSDIPPQKAKTNLEINDYLKPTNQMTAPVVLRSDDRLHKPTNIWNYNGLRVENVIADYKKALLKRFSVYGKVKSLEPMRNSRTTIWVYYDNPVSPVEAIAGLQGVALADICCYQRGEPLPIRLYFAPTNDQPELKFCRPKQPADNKGECYYWRTTNCSLDDKCQLLHIDANKHIDAQVWMKTRDSKAV